MRGPSNRSNRPQRQHNRERLPSLPSRQPFSLPHGLSTEPRRDSLPQTSRLKPTENPCPCRRWWAEPHCTTASSSTLAVPSVTVSSCSKTKRLSFCQRWLKPAVITACWWTLTTNSILTAKGPIRRNLWISLQPSDQKDEEPPCTTR